VSESVATSIPPFPRVIAFVLGILLTITPTLSAAQEPASQESSSRQQQTEPVVQSGNQAARAPAGPSTESATAALPDSPGTARSQANSETQTGAAGQPGASGTQQPQPPAEVQQKRDQQPVGTAVAEPANTSGIAASEPAGVAVAPAKQHRTRVLLIKVGALVGAGVALGTVVALSKASPSKPPGAP
jgi:hypothetical protein